MTDTIVRSRPSGAPGDVPAAPPPSSGGAPAATTRTTFVPTRRELIDIVALGLLLAIGVFGFGKAYGGVRYFVAGVVGVVLGLVVAHVCARTRQPLVVVTAAVIVTYFLFGGPVVVPDEALGGVLPSPGVVTALVDGIVNGWARLLTTLPPAGGTGRLFAVPYACGLLGGVTALTIAARSRRPLLAVVPPAVVLVLSILFGVRQPASLLLQGSGFAALSLGWVALRYRHRRLLSMQSRASRRRVGAVLMLAIAGVVGFVGGDSLPGARSHDRFVLRERTQPPFDPRDYPSPLVGYRRYTRPQLLADATLFTVEGLEAGDRIRLATLDSYDGVTYHVGHGAGSSGYFQRVGGEIPASLEGEARTVTIEVRDYGDVWLPTFGAVRRIEFLSGRADELLDSLRYNIETGTAAVQGRVHKGDRYRLTAVPLPGPSEIGGRATASVEQPPVVDIQAVRDLAGIYATGEDGEPPESGVDRARAIVERLNANGVLSDGEANQSPSRPGHDVNRLVSMVDSSKGAMVGNGEQFGPLAALMARAVGVPARVVMGFVVPDGATASEPVDIEGKHVNAWIEVAVEGVGWVPLPVLRPVAEQVQDIPKPKPTPQALTPPPPPPPVPTIEEDETDPNKVREDETSRRRNSGGFPIPVVVLYAGAAILAPIAALGSITGVIAFVKLRRRRRRRRTGPPSQRIAGGWHEITDLASDLGAPVPPRTTRGEAAAMIGHRAAVELARHADQAIFGPAPLGEAEVDQFWGEVDGTRTAILSDRTRFERWKALVNLASLRNHRRRARWSRDLLAARVASPAPLTRTAEAR